MSGAVRSITGTVKGIFGGGGSSGGGTQTTTSSSAPWAGQQPYLREQFEEAQRLYQSGQLSPRVMAGSQIAGFAPETLRALEMQAQRATEGSPLLRAGQEELGRTIGGEYLRQGNPYMDAIMGDVEARVTPAVAGQFAGSGRYGSGMHARATADALASAGSQLGYQQYGDERTRQMQAMMFAPQMAQADYQDAAALSDVGRTREEMEQLLLNEQQQKFMQNQMREQLALQNYANLIQGNYGSEGAMQQPVAGRNRLGDALGMATAGAGLGQMIGTGTKTMAGIGGLLGLFSDRRLKENIKKVGKLDNGLDVYSYNYIWDKTPQIGLMADEVKKVNPEAVINHTSGFDMVVYDKAVL
jgi:hypothetical protein